MTATLTDSTLRTETAGGTGGRIAVTAEAMELANTALIASTRGAGNAGAIILNWDASPLETGL